MSTVSQTGIDRARARERAWGIDSVSRKERAGILKRREVGWLFCFFQLREMETEEDRPRRTTPQGWHQAARFSAAECASALP